MKNIAILIVLACCAIFNPKSAAQTPSSKYQTVLDLKTHGIVIFLPDAKRRAEYIRAKGWAKEADEELEQAARANIKLASMYRAHFDFCKVYFYYSSNEEDLRNGIPVLLNEDLKVDPSIPLPKKLMLGGIYYKPNNALFPVHEFRIENSRIRLDLPSETGFRLLFSKKVKKGRDIISFNKKLQKIYLKALQAQ